MSRFYEPTSRRSFVTSAAAVSAGLAIGIPASRAVLAQDATPAASPVAPGLPPLPEGAIVVAEGLWNPRFLAIGDSGTLYVTENGVGGDEILGGEPETGTSELEGTPGATPVAEEPAGPPSTRGYTGQISQVTSDGTQSVLVSGLASYSDGVGPVGITLGAGEVYFSIGGMGVGVFGIDPLPEENTVNRYVLETGTVEQIANIGQFEVDNNPDGADVNPNLYELAQEADGTLVVTDAGGNTIYTVDPTTGTFELAAVVPTLGQLPGSENVPAEQAERQAVPTGIAVAENGTTFVGLLSEGLPQGVPSVLTLQPDGTFAAAGGTLLFNVGIAVGPDGQVYASQLFGMVEGSDEPGPGSVVRVYADGTVETVVEGLMMPHGITFDVAGNIYIASNSLMSAPGAPAGQVIRIDGVAAV